MIQKILLNKAIDYLSRKFKLLKILKYVEEPNELDHKVNEHEVRIKSHSDRLIAIEKKIKKIK